MNSVLNINEVHFETAGGKIILQINTDSKDNPFKPNFLSDLALPKVLFTYDLS